MGIKLTTAELAPIRKWGEFYQALESGRQAPKTDAEYRFISVCRGEVLPSNEHERLWMKFGAAQAQAASLPASRKVGERKNTPTTASPPPKREAAPRRQRSMLEKATKLTPERIEQIRESKRQKEEARQRKADEIARENERIADDRRRREALAEDEICAGKAAADELDDGPTGRKKRVPKYRARPNGASRGSRMPEFEEGAPRPGWFTDDDWRKMRKRYDGRRSSKAGN